MLPNLRFVFAAALATIVLVFGVVGLIASRMPVGPHVMRERAAPLTLVDTHSIGDFEGRAVARRRDELNRLLSIQIGPAGAQAGEPPVVAVAGDQETVAAPTPAPVVAANPIVEAAVPLAGSASELMTSDSTSERSVVVAVLQPQSSETPAAPLASFPVVAVEPPPALVLVASVSVAEPRIRADFDLTAAVTLTSPVAERPVSVPVAPAAATEVASLPPINEPSESAVEPQPVPAAAAPDAEPDANLDAPANAANGNPVSTARVPWPRKPKANSTARPRRAVAVRSAPPKRVRVAARPVRPHPRTARKPAQRTAVDPTRAYWQQQQQWWGATQQQPRAATRASRRAPGRSESQ
jgi:hypothetical protein